MAVQDWSTNPAANVAIDGVNIAEGCPPANMNDMGRRIMASVRVMYNGLPNTDTLMPKAGAPFTGNPTFNGRGGYVHHANSAFTDGRLHLLPEGSARPTPAEGVMVFYYS